MKYKDFIKKVKSIDNRIDFLNILPLHDFVIEQRITKGKYKVTLEFDAKEVLKESDSIPIKESDMKYNIKIMIIKFKTRNKEEK